MQSWFILFSFYNLKERESIYKLLVCSLYEISYYDQESIMPSSFDHLAAPLWLLFGGKDFINDKVISLLRHIDSLGSLSKAARAVPMSYRSAWDLIDRLNNLSSHSVVTTSTGGRHGGGTQLSEYGRSLLKLYSSLEKSYRTVFSTFRDVMADTEQFFKLVKGLCMKTSARNQLAGIVKSITKGKVNCQVMIDIGNGIVITAIITNESADELSLQTGTEVIALIKAPSVIIFPGTNDFKCSTENKFYGKVADIRLGQVNGEVLLEIAPGRIITSVISKDSVESLEIKIDKPMYAAFSSSQVIIALAM